MERAQKEIVEHSTEGASIKERFKKMRRYPRSIGKISRKKNEGEKIEMGSIVSRRRGRVRI